MEFVPIERFDFERNNSKMPHSGKLAQGLQIGVGVIAIIIVAATNYQLPKLSPSVNDIVQSKRLQAPNYIQAAKQPNIPKSLMSQFGPSANGQAVIKLRNDSPAPIKVSVDWYGDQGPSQIVEIPPARSEQDFAIVDARAGLPLGLTIHNEPGAPASTVYFGGAFASGGGPGPRQVSGFTYSRGQPLSYITTAAGGNPVGVIGSF